MPIRRSGVGLRHSYSSSVSNAPFSSALRFPASGATNSDIRIIWNGSNFLSRTAHTILFRWRAIANTGYYAWWWHGALSGAFGGTYEYGTHPYPTDTAALEVGGNGQIDGAAGTGAAGTNHYFEIAGLGAKDYLASSQPGTTYPVTKDSTWRWGARQAVVNGSDIRHRYYVDLSDTSKVIVQDYPSATISGAAPGSPALWFGSSDWTTSGNTNSEAACGDFNGFQFYTDGSISAATLQTLATYTNDAQVIAGVASGSLFYCNMNPSHTDVSDKSGNGRNPSWANAIRPATLSF